MSVVGRWLDRVFCALFLLSAGVQVNDPDPMAWMAIYTAAAAVCVLPSARRVRTVAAWLVSASATAWAFWLTPAAMQLTDLHALTETMSAERPEVEAAREALGLAIVATWTAIVGLREQWARIPSRPTPPTTGPHH